MTSEAHEFIHHFLLHVLLDGPYHIRGCPRFPPLRICDLRKGLSLSPCRIESILSRTMPLYHCVYAPCQVQFMTAGNYRRVPLYIWERS